MAETIENLRIQLSFETEKWKTQTAAAAKNLDDLNHRFNTTSKRADKARGSMRGLGSALAGIVSLHMGREILNTTLAFDRMANRMKFATRGAEDFNNMMKLTEETSNELGLSLLDTQRGFSTIAAAARGSALEGAPVIELFKGVSQAAAAIGLTADETNSVFTAFGQIISKGTVQAEELRGQIGERLPQALQAAARALGVTEAKLGDMLRRGEVTANDLLPKLAKELQNTFGEQAVKNATSLTAQMNRLNNAVKLISSSTAKWALENLYVADGYFKIAEQVEAARIEEASNNNLVKNTKERIRKELLDTLNATENQNKTYAEQKVLLKGVADNLVGVVKKLELGSQEAAQLQGYIKSLSGQTLSGNGNVSNRFTELLASAENLRKETELQIKLDKERLEISKLIAKQTFDSPLFTEYRDALKDQEESANRFLKNTEAQQMAQAKARAEILRQQKIREDEMRTDKALLSQAEKKLDILKEQEKVLRRTSGVNFLQSARSGSNADIRASIEARTVALGGADFNEDLLEQNLAEQRKQSDLLNKIEKRLNVEKV